MAHARRFVDGAVDAARPRTTSSFVVEVASNDGYLLQHVVARGIRSLGIEPAANIAEVARAKGIPTEVDVPRRGDRRATSRARHGQADLVVANNVFAHVPDIVDFAKGLRALVADDGWSRIEIPHLLRLIEGNEYDTIYHEHYSYLSLLTDAAGAGRGGPDRGRRRGAAHARRLAADLVDARPRPPASPAPRVDARARRRGGRRAAHASRATTASPRRSRGSRNDLVEFLIERARRGQDGRRLRRARARATRCSTTAASAPTCSRSPSTATRTSTGMFLPGTHIPIHPPERLAEDRPDYVLILPWNLRDEISRAARLRPRLGRPAGRRLPDSRSSEVEWRRR